MLARSAAKVAKFNVFSRRMAQMQATKTTAELSPTITRVESFGPEGHKSRKGFRGPLKAAVLDWSGTTADAHVIAPAVVFVEVFKKHGCEISMAEARGPMGLRKDLHIGKIFEIPEVAARWEKLKGKKPNTDRSDPNNDVDILFTDFVPMQVNCLPEYTDLLPGTVNAVDSLREKNMKIGVSTGFTSPMVDVLLEAAKVQGFVPDSSVAGDQVDNNMGFRPAPFMVYQNLVNLGVYPIESVVKVDDTTSGVGEGLNAGCWSVGIYGLSNYTDVDTMAQWNAMNEEEKLERQMWSKEKLLKESGAHYVIESIKDLPEVCDDINRRLANGEMP